MQFKDPFSFLQVNYFVSWPPAYIQLLLDDADYVQFTDESLNADADIMNINELGWPESGWNKVNKKIGNNFQTSSWQYLGFCRLHVGEVVIRDKLTVT